MIRKVVGLHFSPVGGTAKITERIVRELAEDLSKENAEKVDYECYDVLHNVSQHPDFDEETIAVIGLPVYVGKIPVSAVRLMESIDGKGAMTVAFVSYGTTSYGNALYELYNFAEHQGFKVVGAGAFITRHLNKGRRVVLTRPDQGDLESIRDFCRATAGKLRRLSGSEIEGLRIKPMPLMIEGRIPRHRISRISPIAAAAAQFALERTNIKRREPEWFL